MNKICISGRTRSGKSWLANTLSYEEISFAEPIYILAKYFFGSDKKNLDGMRAWMQLVGQIGKNFCSKKYPVTIERATFVDNIRRNGMEIFRQYPEYNQADWSKFGTYETFWVDILIDRVTKIIKDNPEAKLAVTNVRFPFELEPLKQSGFEHFHVICTQDTRVHRIQELGEEYNIVTDTDASEQMAIELDKRPPYGLIIWNDEFVKKPQPSFMDLDEFKKLINE